MLKINPIKLFVFLLMASVGLGLSVQKFLNSDYLSNYIEKKLLVVSSESTKINYKDFKVFVSKSSFVPTLVLQVNEISVFIPDKCRSQTNVVAKKLLSPVNLLSALWYRKDVRLNIEFENVIVERKPYKCNTSVAKQELIGPREISTEESLKLYLETGMRRLPRLNFLSHKLTKRLKVININHLLYIDLMNNNKKSKLDMDFNNLEVKLDPGVINIQSEASWPYHKVLDQSLQIPQFKFLYKNNSASLKVLAKVREGHLALDASANEKTKQVSLNFRVKQTPLGESVKLIKNTLGYNIGYSSPLSWLNCYLRINGTIEEIFSRPQKINQCQVAGELGEWNLSPYKFKLAALNMQTEPIHLVVKKAPIKKAMNFLGLKRKLKMISKFGLYTGTINWQPSNHGWKSSGFIKNLEVDYKIDKRSINQLVKSIQFEAAGNDTNYIFTANQFKLDDAEFDGEINYKHNYIDRVGKIYVTLKKLAFGRELQKTFLKMNTEFTRGELQGTVKRDSYTIEGRLYSDALESAYVKTGPYEVQIRAREGSIDGNLVISQLNFTDELYSLEKLNLSKVIDKKHLVDLEIVKPHLDFEVDSRSIIWKLSNYGNKELNKELVFSNFGTINNSKLYSQLDFFMPRKEVSWEWRGALAEPIISLVRPSVSDENSMAYSPAVQNIIFNSKNNNKPTGLGTTIIKKAKEILPIKGN